MPPTLVLIDGNALVHRAFHALPPLTTGKGELVNAVYGFASMLLKVLSDVKPEYVAVAFDRAAPTFRHLEFEAYKAHRPKTADGLPEQFALVRQLIDAFGVPAYEIDGFEADDVLGTLARQAEEMGLETLIVTGDTDALQLVTPHTRVLTPQRIFSETTIYDEEAVRNRYGLEPRQLVDFKALKGDPSDNIPGVPGVGERTASKLLQEHGSLDALYANLESVPEKQRKLLSSNEAIARQSHHLALIVRDVPLELDLAACRTGRFDRVRLVELFRELEFRSLLARLPSATAAAPVEAVPSAAPGGPQQMAFFETAEATRPSVVQVAPPPALGDYRVVTTPGALEELASILEAAPEFAFDVESTHLDPIRARLVGLSFAVTPGQAFYVPVGHNEEAAVETGQLALADVLARLGPLLADPHKSVVGHNLKYDTLVLDTAGLKMKGIDFDTMVAAYLLARTPQSVGLKELAFARFGLELRPITDLIGRGKAQVTMAEVPVPAATTYACADADIALRLRQELTPELHAEGQWDLFTQVEMPLVPVLARMEATGVALDLPYLQAISAELFQRIKELERRIYVEVGHQFNLNSPQQLGTVLFEELGLPSGRRTKTGHSTEAAILERLRGAHPVLDMILEYRQLVKMKSTYVDALPLLVNQRTGRVHTSFNQTVAATGRLSSSDPNLQNIPIRTELGRRVRRAFVAGRPEHVLLSADYSQIELRILAHVTQDERLVGAFAADEDVHAATAAELFGVALGEVTPDMRRLAKTINFGVLYGMREYGLSQRVDLSLEEASAYINRYLSKYRGVQIYLDRTLQQARLQGYVSTLLGRRRYLPEVNSPSYPVRQSAERMAINAPIQGTAADMIKIAMIRLAANLDDVGLPESMLLQVHDELLLEVPLARVGEIAELMRETMAGAMPLDVPVNVDVKSGCNWEEMKPL
ncbi:MAG: DNA polymerase I [Chloroflexota bacterium]